MPGSQPHSCSLGGASADHRRLERLHVPAGASESAAGQCKCGARSPVRKGRTSRQHDGLRDLRFYLRRTITQSSSSCKVKVMTCMYQCILAQFTIKVPVLGPHCGNVVRIRSLLLPHLLEDGSALASNARPLTQKHKNAAFEVCILIDSAVWPGYQDSFACSRSF